MRMIFGCLVLTLWACSPRLGRISGSPSKDQAPLGTDDQSGKEGQDQSPDQPQGEDDSEPKAPDPNLPETAAAPSTYIEKAFIDKFIEEIAGPQSEGRGSGSKHNDAVAELIAAEFEKIGLKPGGDDNSYFQAFNARGSRTRNIIGILPGKSDEIIVIGAHMDHLGVRDGKTFFGADDNASGTVALVATAKALTQSKAAPDRTLVFIAFSAEELGLLGSIHFVKNPSSSLSLPKIKFMLNLDMVGRSNGKLTAFSFDMTTAGNRIIRELVSKTSLKTEYVVQTTGGRSDHQPFREAGIPVAMFFTNYHDEYHQPTDTTDKIDKENLGVIAGLATDFTWNLAKEAEIVAPSFALGLTEPNSRAQGIAIHGCEPALASFEDLEADLLSLRKFLREKKR